MHVPCIQQMQRVLHLALLPQEPQLARSMLHFYFTLKKKVSCRLFCHLPQNTALIKELYTINTATEHWSSNELTFKLGLLEYYFYAI